MAHMAQSASNGLHQRSSKSDVTIQNLARFDRLIYVKGLHSGAD
jgi:hypothetical protein